MTPIKTKDEIAAMKKGGKMLADTLWQVVSEVKPGVTELAVDERAEQLILEKGGESGFKLVSGYNHTICAATNDVVVHGIPRGDYMLKKGDALCIDCGVYYNGLHTDMAETIIVGGDESASEEVRTFLEIGKKALHAGIKAVKAGNRVGHISKAIQDIVEGEGGYSVVRSLVGHGVGRELHEAPEVPGYLAKKIEKTPLLKEDMTIAVEVIYNMGRPEVMLDRDGWTIRSKDGSLSAVFERTVRVTKNGAEMLTP